MFRLLFRGHWLAQMVFAALAFAAAAFFYMAHQQIEAEKAQARANGMPAAVSLNAFDPEKDVHPADEVHVIGWINPEFNYQLTEEHRRGADVVRRMFVLFGPDDAPDTKAARAVVLMAEGDVDRFADIVVANVSNLVGGNPVFSLNGTGGTSATLDDMADDALREKGLTKAPGFRYIELWPAGGRDEGLRADPVTGLYIAGAAAGFGVLMLGLAVLTFRRRNRKPALSQMDMPQSATPVAGQPWAIAAAAPMATEAGQAPARRKSLPMKPESWSFLIVAILVGVIGNWAGSWQLTVLAGVLILVHFVARVKAAMDRGVEAVATAVTALRTPDAATATTTVGLSGRSPGPQDEDRAVQTVPSLTSRLFGAGRARGGRSMGFGGAMALVVLAALALGNQGLLDMKLPGMPGFSASAGGTVGPEAAGPVAASEPVQAAEAAPATTPADKAPAEAAALADPAPVTTAPVVDQPLIPEAASLRPGPGETGAIVIAAAEPSLPASAPSPVTAAAPAPGPVEPAAAPEAAPAPVAATPTEPAAAPATAEAQPDPAEEAPSLQAGLSLPGFGGLMILAPIAGAVLLAVAAFALMRGRQAAPPAVFAGRDPWDRLAREARGA
jgi:hypothetical protein